MSTTFHGVKIEYEEDTFDGKNQWRVTIPPRDGDDAILAPFGYSYFDNPEAAMHHVTTVMGSTPVKTVKHAFSVTEQASGRFRVEDANVDESDVGFWGWHGTYDSLRDAVEACAEELIFQWNQEDE